MRLESSFIQIPKVGEQTELTLWDAGITDWRAGVDTTTVGPTRREAINEFAHNAVDALGARDIPFFADRLPAGETWRLAETFRDDWTALDIETTGLDQSRDRITTVSVHDASGTRTYVRGKDLTAEAVRTELDQAGLLVTFNGAQFDLPFLGRAFDLSIDLPHIDLRYPCQRLGWRGGLTAVERRVGIERDQPDIDGRMAVRLWSAYRDGDTRSLERLIAYNREDTALLVPVLEAVTEALDAKTIDQYGPASAN